MRLMPAFLVLGVIGIVEPSEASTLRRASLDSLIASHHLIVVGEVLEVTSHWNADGTFIFTDARIAVADVLKGKLTGGEITVTLMGGTVGDRTVLIVGGAELVPGKAYVLFLDRRDLPSTQKALTVAEHCQGVFDIEMTGSGLRALSQARRQLLIPDSLGSTEPPGGTQGIDYSTFTHRIRETAGQQRQEVIQ